MSWSRNVGGGNPGNMPAPSPTIAEIPVPETRGAPLGHANASTANRLWKSLLKRKAIQEPDRLGRIAEQLFKLAEAGDLKAIQELGDRLDGKPASQLELRNPVNDDGTDAPPVTINIVGVKSDGG